MIRSIAELLRYRTEFECITAEYSMIVQNDSSINTIEWFIENGHRSNSLRNGFNRAKEIATLIKEYVDGSTKEIRTGK